MRALASAVVRIAYHRLDGPSVGGLGAPLDGAARGALVPRDGYGWREITGMAVV